MKQNGFISSALLYGMLALFLVIMTSTLAILANQKLGMDKIKEKALNGIQYGYAKVENIYALYDGFQAPTNNKWKDQSGNNRDATLIGFPSNNYYANRHLIFNGTSSYLNTGINQVDLGDEITFSIVINLKKTAGESGLWGYYDETSGTGIYAKTNNGKINICYYGENKNTVCIDVGSEFFTNYLNKIIQLTVVMVSGEDKEKEGGMEIYVNDISYDNVESPLTIKPHSGTLIIGNSLASNTNMMQADLYNFTIYNTALTYDDVMKNFEANRVRYNITS
ncbi:MAG: LamG domain-containing protein [Bacilli bacterium]|nr:LamG domain-containing protein [Bacilli bacterium]